MKVFSKLAVLGALVFGQMGFANSELATSANLNQLKYSMRFQKETADSVRVLSCNFADCRDLGLKSTELSTIYALETPLGRKVAAVTLGLLETGLLGLLSGELVVAEGAWLLIWGGSQWTLTRVDFLNPLYHWKLGNQLEVAHNAVAMAQPLSLVILNSEEELLALEEVVLTLKESKSKGDKR